MIKAIQALFSSRKFVIVFFVSCLGGAFVWFGKIPIADFEKFVGAISAVLIGAIAYEDGKKGPAQLVTGKQLLDMAAPVLTAIAKSIPPAALPSNNEKGET